MNLPLNLAVNARFLGRPASGVDRVAIELVAALASRADIGKISLVHPPSARLQIDWIAALPAASRAKLSLCSVGRRQGHLWEQLELPRVFPERPLLSLCSTGPVLRRNQAVMIHDAQVWDAPQSYSWPFRLLYRGLLPTLGHSARHVLTVSEFAADRLVKVGITRKGRPRVIFNGVDHILRTDPDPATMDRHGLTPGYYILAIGNLAPHKNLRLLVEAAAARAPGAPPLVVAGGMNARVFADAGLPQADGVRYIGRVTDGELRALYTGALALAFPSLTEGFGLPPVEAMLCGCPVIATTGGAVPEICGDAALFIDPLNRPAWTDALTRIAQDTSLRKELTAKGNRQAIKYTWDSAAQLLVEVLT